MLRIKWLNSCKGLGKSEHTVNISYYMIPRGVPTVVQQDWQCLGNAGTQVWSLAQHGGSGIWYCHSCSLGGNRGSSLILGPGPPCTVGQPKERKKKKERKKSKGKIPRKMNGRLGLGSFFRDNRHLSVKLTTHSHRGGLGAWVNGHVNR